MNSAGGISTENCVAVAGKVSGREPLSYTPAGVPVLEFTLAVPQQFLAQKSVGYFQILMMGEGAEAWSRDLRVGKQLSVKGQLRSRQFRDRKGRQISELKIIAESIGEKNGNS